MKVQSSVRPAPVIPPIPASADFLKSLVLGKAEEKAPEALAPKLREAVSYALTLCCLVYYDLEDAKGALEQAGAASVQCFTGGLTDTQALCFVQDGRAYLAFRGSESVQDWLNDFMFLPFFRPLRHLGFEWSWRTHRKAITGWLAQHKGQYGDIVLCGHSLGGGIAHMAAFELSSDYGIAGVYTFGAPKACFGKTARRYDDTPVLGREGVTLRDVSYCTVNQKDIVAKVPFSWMGYRPVGQLIYIDYAGDIYAGDAAWDRRRGDSDAGWNYILSLIGESSKPAYILPGSLFYAEYYKGVLAEGPKAWLREVLHFFYKIYPPIAFAILFPYLYFLFFRHLLQSGFAHLQTKYLSVFFGQGVMPKILKGRKHTKNWKITLNRMALRLIGFFVAVLALCGFAGVLILVYKMVFVWPNAKPL